MKCPACGREAREGSRFCPGCGAGLEAAAGEGAGAVAAGKSTWFWVAVVVACALFVAGAAFAAIYFAVLRPDGQAAPDRTGAVSLEEEEGKAEKESAEAGEDAARREEKGPFGKMAFIRDGDVWMHDLESGEEARLTEDGTCTAPDLRPDGKKVVYASEKGAHADPSGYPVYTQIYEVDVSTRETRKVIDLPDWRCYDPAYSPDGGEIAFGRFSRQPRSGTEDYPVRDAELCLLDLKSGKLTTVARGESGPEWISFLNPEFLDGGRNIAYLNAYEGGGDAEMVPRSGGTARPIALEGYDPSQYPIDTLVFSRDGKKMAVAFMWEPEGLFIEDLLTGEVSEARGLSDLGLPRCFSPGGRYLAFDNYNDESIWIAEIEGSYREMITRGNQADWEP